MKKYMILRFYVYENFEVNINRAAKEGFVLNQIVFYNNLGKEWFLVVVEKDAD